MILFSGLQTSQDARFYALSARFDDVSNQGQSLVIQFTVKHEQSIDCGGGYIKLFPSELNQEDMHGDSTYNIMFGQSGSDNLSRCLISFLIKTKNTYLELKHYKCDDLQVLISAAPAQRRFMSSSIIKAKTI